MIHFRRNAEMFVPKPKKQLAHYTDLSMPRRNWSRLDVPACTRLDARSVCASQFGARAIAA
jgi:hypothetical protein